MWICFPYRIRPKKIHSNMELKTIKPRNCIIQYVKRRKKKPADLFEILLSNWTILSRESSYKKSLRTMFYSFKYWRINTVFLIYSNNKHSNIRSFRKVYLFKKR